MTSGNTVRLDFHSSLSMVDFVQVVSDHIARMTGLDDDSIHWVSVAVRESVINAIKHGNCYDVRKRVHIEFPSSRTQTAMPGPPSWSDMNSMWTRLRTSLQLPCLIALMTDSRTATLTQ